MRSKKFTRLLAFIHLLNVRTTLKKRGGSDLAHSSLGCSMNEMDADEGGRSPVQASIHSTAFRKSTLDIVLGGSYLHAFRPSLSLRKSIWVLADSVSFQNTAGMAQ